MKRFVFILSLFFALNSFGQIAGIGGYMMPRATEEPVVEGCVEYGYLYNWYAAADSRKITSSDDWVVPTTAQCNTLISYLGGTSVAGGKLKETGLIYWNSTNTGATNEVNFNGRGSGARSSELGHFVNKGQLHYIWTLTNRSENNYYYFLAGLNNSTYANTFNYQLDRAGSAIRLLYIGAGTPTEYVGNNGVQYGVVQIGTQFWIDANLAETKYRNGDPIPTVEDNATWAGLTTGAKCAYENNMANVGCGETGLGSTLEFTLYSSGTYPYSFQCDQWGTTPTDEQSVKNSIDLHISLLNGGCSTVFNILDLGHRIYNMSVGQPVFHRDNEGEKPVAGSLNRWIAYFKYQVGTGYNGYTYYVAFVNSNGILTTVYEYPEL